MDPVRFDVDAYTRTVATLVTTDEPILSRLSNFRALHTSLSDNFRIIHSPSSARKSHEDAESIVIYIAGYHSQAPRTASVRPDPIRFFRASTIPVIPG